MKSATFQLILRSRNPLLRRILQRARWEWIPRRPTSYSTIRKDFCNSSLPPRAQQKDMAGVVVADREAADTAAGRAGEAMVPEERARAARVQVFMLEAEDTE